VLAAWILAGLTGSWVTVMALSHRSCVALYHIDSPGVHPVGEACGGVGLLVYVLLALLTGAAIGASLLLSRRFRRLELDAPAI
jgi:hypothetical protein